MGCFNSKRKSICTQDEKESRACIDLPRNKERRACVDLPQDILVLLFKKLYIDGDQIRFRAVCKDWRLHEDFIRSSDCDSWVRNQPFMTFRVSDGIVPLGVVFCDPWSEETGNLSLKSIKVFGILSDNTFPQLTLYDSKYGWLLLSTSCEKSWIFLHNPFTKEAISLPYMDDTWDCLEATFTKDPSCSECEVLMLCRPRVEGPKRDALYVGRCCLVGDMTWSMKYLETIEDEHPKVCYMNGELYCLFSIGVLKSYNLVDKSWKLVVESLPWPRASSWLVENEGKLMIIGWNTYGKYCIFGMDWCERRWIDMGGSLLNTAFFVSGKSLLMSDVKYKIKRQCALYIWHT